jgi:hypothetical protein
MSNEKKALFGTFALDSLTVCTQQGNHFVDHLDDFVSEYDFHLLVDFTW